MAMPDAIDGLLRLAEALPASLTRTAYNLSAFSPTAQQIHDVVTAAFPDAALGWRTDAKRQAIVDSWPADVDDSAARRDWGYAPAYDFARAFSEYLIPTIRERY
jgi:nucleoside-diphosphate-sugar epimerase